MQEKMIELRTKDDKWVLVNCRHIKCVVFDRQPDDRSLFKATILYYGDEGELELLGRFTEEECRKMTHDLCLTNSTISKDLATAHEQVEFLKKTLLLIGEKAMLDFDDVTVGQVDGAVPIKEHHKYKDWLCSVLKIDGTTTQR